MPEQLVEFRNYRSRPDGTDEFIRHFEAHFLESQELLGMDIVGQFRVVDDPGRFVWVRRYLDPSTRAESLERFYTGPVWKEFGPRANELMLDHTDVHLLVPEPSGPVFAEGHVAHADRRGDPVAPQSTVVAAIFDTGPGVGISPALAADMSGAVAGVSGVSELGRLVTAGVPNDFPVLPVHEASVALWLLSDDGRDGSATTVVHDVAAGRGMVATTLHLAPTARSTLR